MNRFLALGSAFLLTVVGCSGLVIDTSTPAADAGDFTLAISACGATPGIGFDICRVTEGDEIASSWKMVVPQGSQIQGGEIDVYYRDLHKQYPISGIVVEVPWRDFFGQATWSSDLDGEAMALLVVRWKDDTGLIQITKFRGLAKIVVTKKGYDRMPIDSGFHTWETNCKIQYSTAGRSALQCK